MSIDAIFIPCAGRGTRMGDVGKVKPKPLWPLFDSTLLEFQVNFFKSMGFNKIIINTHHLAEQFNSIKGINILHEKDLLGSGGSIHNLKRAFPNLKKVLISNPDIFFNLSSQQWRSFFEDDEDKNVNNKLLGLSCRKTDTYNELVIDKSQIFEGVARAPARSYLTYSGVGIIDLDSLEEVKGSSSFFKTVVNPEFNRTKVVEIGERKEYWDFGTLELYKNSHLKILNNKKNSMGVLLKRLSVLNEQRDYLNSTGMRMRDIQIDFDDDMSIKQIRLIR